MSVLNAPVVARRRTEVEALRGLAALAVLVSHAWGIGHDYSPYVLGTHRGRLGLLGGQGLALFFALSGYLLTRMFLGERRVGLPRYFRHRAARIMPTWLLVLAVMLLVHSDGVPVSRWWRFPLLLQGFWADTTIRVDGPAWSLALEAQFYLLLPLLALLLRRQLRVALVAVLGLGLASAALMLATVTFGSPGLVWFYSLPVNFVYFTPGVLLAVLEARTRLVERLAGITRVRGLLLLGSVPGWLAFVVYPKADLLVVVAAGLTVAAVALPLGEGRLVELLRGRVLLAAGTLSFGIYLWHEPVVRLLRENGAGGWASLLLLTAPISVALAAVSFFLVERPFLLLRDASAADLRGPAARVAGLGLGVTAAVAVIAVALA